MSDEERAELVAEMVRMKAEALLEQVDDEVIGGLRPLDLDTHLAVYLYGTLARRGIEHCRLN